MLSPIGVVRKVFFNKIVIEIDDMKKLNQNYKGDIYSCEGLDTFILLEKSYEEKLIYQISALYDEEKPLEKEDNSKFQIKAYFEAVPIGNIIKEKFEYGIERYPLLGDEVYLTSKEELNKILGNDLEINENNFIIGELSNKKGYYPKINIDNFFTTHISILGNTGSGKSTTGRALLRLYQPTDGEILFEGKDIATLTKGKELLEFRKEAQMIFQDPADSMNSRMNVGYIIEEPLLIQTKMAPHERKEKVMGLLKYVGLPEDAYYRYPHEFSGGQRQRIAIARALVLDPEVVVCDEPVSALDVSVQSQVLNLLLDMQKERNLTLLFISHGLNVVKHMSDRVAVMYLGSIMEMAPSVDIYKDPLHPYTQALIAAIPDTDPDNRRRRIPFTGEIPSPIHLPTGCPFHLNCSKKIDKCAVEKPVLREVADGHMCACHLI